MSSNVKNTDNAVKQDKKAKKEIANHEASVERSNDTFKWLGVFILAAAAIVGNIYFRDYQYVSVRIIAVIAVMALAVGLALLTTKGKSFINLARESRTELRKVIWPTRKEATQTTMIVAAITILISLILWGLDGILIRLVTLITKFGVGV
ncbi:preprotein translocase subunit SecE [Thorsellia kenyensis]|uniref:Protein translocase subunit SecE n=1 Tax=Thorsellia kenyensis TaxID=1549888 RepID=A0ABV6C9I3_9GAMM